MARREVITLLGTIDTPEEALFWAASLSYVPDCRTRVTRAVGGFLLNPISPDGIRCAPGMDISEGLEVRTDGSLRDPKGGLIFDLHGCAVMMRF